MFLLFYFFNVWCSGPSAPRSLMYLLYVWCSGPSAPHSLFCFTCSAHPLTVCFGFTCSAQPLTVCFAVLGPSLCIFFLCNAQALPMLFILYGAQDHWQTKFNLIFILFYNLFYMWKERRKIIVFERVWSRDFTI